MPDKDEDVVIRRKRISKAKEKEEEVQQNNKEANGEDKTKDKKNNVLNNYGSSQKVQVRSLYVLKQKLHIIGLVSLVRNYLITYITQHSDIL